MNVVPIAFDSMGVRSMATLIKTRDVRVMIDPGAALGPNRYNLPPHARELEMLAKLSKKIKVEAARCDVIIITHYHYDHYDPDDVGMYKDKVVLIKHPTESINKSQSGRAKRFLKAINGVPARLEFSDTNEFRFGNTSISFSDPVPHGPTNKLGYVTEVLVDDGERFIHSSDVEGPCLDEQVSFILKHDPKYVILDGPLSYMLGFRYSHSCLDKSLQNLLRIIDSGELTNLVVDHHFLRDAKWLERIREVKSYADEVGVKVLTAAEFAGGEVNALESTRNLLFRLGDG